MGKMISIIALVTLFVLVFRLVRNLNRQEHLGSTKQTIPLLLLGYGIVWLIFYLKSKEVPISFGTPVCIDEWCATVTGFEHPARLGSDASPVLPKGQFILLKIKTMNESKRFTEEPYGLRIRIFDENNDPWLPSRDAQKALNQTEGKQSPLNKQLRPGQNAETILVYDLPKRMKRFRVRVDEGSWINRIMLPEDKEVFLINLGP